MRTSLLLVFSFVFMIGFSGALKAQELNTSEACTTPRGDVVSPDDDRWMYCDIHMRQFEHRKRIIELQDSLNARAENFKASTKPVIDNYKEALRAHHESLGSE